MSFLRQRHELLADLREQSQPSVLIVGAGINGCAVFRDLACQRVDALLIDQADFCAGTSAASSNLIHGGLRYLEYGKFRLVREAIQERNRLLKNATHYVKPLPTRIPLFSRSSGILNAPLQWLRIPRSPKPRGTWAVRLGLSLYDIYSRTIVSDLPSSSLAKQSESLAQFPALNPGIRWTAQYFDAVVLNPERLALQLIQEGESRHADCRSLNYMRLKTIGPDGVVLQDLVGGESLNIRPRLIVNAAGPWIDQVNDRLGLRSGYIEGTKGSHLVLNHAGLFEALQGHMFFFENKDGRIVLMYPWHHRVLIGTTDIPIQDPGQAVCTPQEEAYLLEMIPFVFPQIVATSKDVVFRYSGVRPLGAATGPAASISRDHVLQFNPASQGRPPIYALVGGKWTTFRAFAEQTVDALLRDLQIPRRMKTDNLPIGVLVKPHRESAPEVSGIKRNTYRTLYQRYGEIPSELGTQLTQATERHSFLAGTTYLLAELDFLCRHERVVHLDDLLLRRTQLAKLGLLNPQNLQIVARLAATSLGWSPAKLDEELERCLQILKKQHGLMLS